MNQFTNIKISNCVTGISMPSDAPVTFKNLVIDRCDEAIRIHSPASLYGALGLPANTPPEIVREALTLLLANASSPKEVRVKAVSESRLGRLLSGTANFSSIVGALLQVQESGLINKALDALSAL